MGATIIKIRKKDRDTSDKPLSPLQKKILNGPVMTAEEYKQYQKNNKWMGKWKI